MSCIHLASAYAEPLKCKDYLAGAREAIATKKLEEYVNRPTISQLHALATGAFLAVSKTRYSDATDAQKAEPAARLAEACALQPEARAADVAISVAWELKKSSETASAKLPAADASAPAAPLATSQPKSAGPTIYAKQIAAGLSDTKTQLEQEKWWKEHMAGKFRAFTGKVKDVKEGSLSGYWVNIDIGRNILVRCGLSDAWKHAAQAIKKGGTFTCRGDVSDSWTSIFGITFSMDAG